MSAALVNRRNVLLGALAIGAVAALSGTVYLPRAGQGYAVLSAAEVTVVTAIAQVMFPGGIFPVDGVQAGVVARVDEILDHDVTEAAKVGFRYLLRAIEWSTLATRGGRFSSLDEADRLEVLTAWGNPGMAPRRIAFDAVKMVMGMAYFGHPEVQAAIGWRNACSGAHA